MGKLFVVLIIFTTIVQTGVSQTTWYVDVNNTSGPWLGSSLFPFRYIQGDISNPGGVHAAVGGDTVIVRPGIYYENLDFNGKNIIVKSEQGAALTIIDGAKSCVVKFHNGEGLSSVLEGFTITNGDAIDGGGVYCSSSPTIKGNIIIDNYANDDGGGVFCTGGAAAPAIINNIIKDNISNGGGGGGGICCFSCGPTISGNTIKGNYASDDGGGVLLNGCASSLSIINNSILNNTANDNGGGICCITSKATISGNTISENIANDDGGGIIAFDASPNITGNIISKNESKGGGGGGGIYCINNSSPLISNNIVSENSSNDDGGGVYCISSSYPNIINNTITKNKAMDCGGGIYCNGGSGGEINGNLIFENVSNDRGGGIFFNSTSRPIYNNLIIQNMANVNGGGIQCYGSSPDIINNTFSLNSATNGGGVSCVNSSNPFVLNAIIWDNIASSSGPEINLDSSSSIKVEYSNVKGGWLGQGNLYGSLNDNPQLDSEGKLTSQSPCINRGSGLGAPVNDVDGDIRPFMGCVDIGADEFIDRHMLGADVFVISDQLGGSINLMLDAGLSNAGRYYLLFGSISGTNPGVPFLISTLPLNWDLFTDLLLKVFWAIPGFDGNLDLSGCANASFSLNAGTGHVGVIISFAYLMDYPLEASNPVKIEITP